MTLAEQARRLAWRFKVLQQACVQSRNVARTCRPFGISWQGYYRWKRRYQTHGDAGLADRPSRPHRSPTRLPGRASVRFCICASTITSVLAKSPTI